MGDHVPVTSNLLIDMSLGNTIAWFVYKESDFSFSFILSSPVLLFSPNPPISKQMTTERTSLLDRRRQSNQTHYDALHNFPSLPSVDNNQAINNNNNSAPPTFITPSYNSPRSGTHGFKLFNRRLGSYDEDRQGLIKENTGVRVWYESYSTIGKSFTNSLVTFGGILIG